MHEPWAEKGECQNESNCFFNCFDCSELRRAGGVAWINSTRSLSFHTTIRRSSRITRRRLLELHHDKHHAAYVTGANATLEKLAEAREQGRLRRDQPAPEEPRLPPFRARPALLFWKNMSPQGGGRASGELAAAIKEFFGSFDAPQESAHRGRAERAGLRLGRPRLGAARPSGSSSSRSTTTRATSETAPCPSWCSTCGSTPTTCNTRT